MVLQVSTQVAILFILIFIGFILAKTKILNDVAVSRVTDMVLLLVTPCVIIKSFVRPFEASAVKGLLISLAAAFAAHILFITVSRFTLFDKSKDKESVLRFGVVFSNCGFMSIPLLEAVLGADGVFYGSAFLAVFNLFVWSYGITLISGDKKYLTPKKLLINPGIIGIIAGLIIFLCSIPVPQIIYEPVSYIASLNTPLPMLIIGYHLAKSNLFAALKSAKCLFAIALRLIFLPVATVLIMYLCGVPDIVLKSTMISCSAPVAAITTMFSSKFGRDTELSVGMVSLSTLLCIATIPFMAWFTEVLTG